VSFRAVDRDLDLVALEQRVLRRWADDDVFAESLRRRAGAPEWVFYEGPPTANGRPGLHHVWARSFKDLFPRFHTMRGKHVERKGGWDCHGLPVELEVEKELGFTGKHEIEDFGIAAFNRRCRESVHRYVEDWSALTSRIGMWIDTADAYWTLDNTYIESVWWHLKSLWDHGLVYEGFKVVPYCGRCGTALSSHEVALGYEDVTEPSVYVRFPVVDADFDLLVWTTTPWTLVSNVAAAVGPELRYVRVAAQPGARDVVLAAERLRAVLGDGIAIVEELNADDLVGLRYERPFDVLPLARDASRVVADPFVTVDEGSGIVHLAPAFGEIDREIGEREGLPVLNPVDATARFDASVPELQGTFVKDADAAIIERLSANGRLLRVDDHTHSYPHCWRCGTPLVYWAKPTWFARTSEHREALLRENERIGWHPEHIKHGRFGDWLANNVDWALSRDRFWGTPLPIWRCGDCGHDTCVGSVTELSALAGRDCSDLDLHRPDVDEIVMECQSCHGSARRVESVLDAWFDSGAMPAAQLHYPFEHADVFERRFPADFICEAIDQTRGWFYSLLAVNTLVFDRAPYRDVVCLALLVDRDGFKMSKSRGNVIDPWSILETRGADALRWYFFSAGSPWTSRRVDEQMIDESTRRFLLTLWNTYSFFVTYATLDGWDPNTHTSSAPTHVLDRWVRSRLHSTLHDVTEALDGFDALRAAQALESFVDDLSNWYVRRSRSRFWRSADPAAHATLHECLRTACLLLAPLCPFVTDEMWSNIGGSGESVHLADWPEPDRTAIDAVLERDVRHARQLVTLGRAARTDARLRVRQPLSRALILLPGGARLPADLLEEVADELNVKRIEPVTDLRGLLEHRVVPSFRRLGPRLGPLMPSVKMMLEQLDGSDVADTLERDGVYRLEVDGRTIELTVDDLEIRAVAHGELALVEDAGYAVALDTLVDEDLRLEGFARELVRAINDLRKAQDLVLSDRIRVVVAADGAIADAARLHGGWIAGEVLATEWRVVAPGDLGGHAHAVDLDGAPVEVALELDGETATAGA
jgi:isoleucyl-tRNA synthetase